MFAYIKNIMKDGVMLSREVDMKPMIIWSATIIWFVVSATALGVMVSGFMGASAAEVAMAASAVGIPSAVGMALLGTVVVGLLFYCRRLLGRRWE